MIFILAYTIQVSEKITFWTKFERFWTFKIKNETKKSAKDDNKFNGVKNKYFVVSNALKSWKVWKVLMHWNH